MLGQASDLAGRRPGRPSGDREHGNASKASYSAGEEQHPDAAEREHLVLARERAEPDEDHASGEPAERRRRSARPIARAARARLEDADAVAHERERQRRQPERRLRNRSMARPVANPKIAPRSGPDVERHRDRAATRPRSGATPKTRRSAEQTWSGARRPSRIKQCEPERAEPDHRRPFVRRLIGRTGRNTFTNSRLRGRRPASRGCPAELAGLLRRPCSRCRRGCRPGTGCSAAPTVYTNSPLVTSTSGSTKSSRASLVSPSAPARRRSAPLFSIFTPTPELGVVDEQHGRTRRATPRRPARRGRAPVTTAMSFGDAVARRPCRSAPSTRSCRASRRRPGRRSRRCPR